MGGLLYKGWEVCGSLTWTLLARTNEKTHAQMDFLFRRSLSHCKHKISLSKCQNVCKMCQIDGSWSLSTRSPSTRQLAGGGLNRNRTGPGYITSYMLILHHSQWQSGTWAKKKKKEEPFLPQSFCPDKRMSLQWHNVITTLLVHADSDTVTSPVI